MDIAKTIAHNLDAWMKATPTLDTIQKVEAKSGVGFGTIRRARNGDGNITVEKLTLIARAFGREPAELLTPPGDPAQPAPASEPAPPAPTPFPARTVREQRIEAINTCLAKTDDYGLVAMLEKAKDVARDYPLRRSETAS